MVYSNSQKAIRDHVDMDDLTKRYPIVDSLGRKQTAIFINESGLYSLILSSKLLQPGAMFLDVVIDEVEVFVAGIDLVVGEYLPDLDDVATLVGLHAAHDGEVGGHGGAGGCVDAQAHHREVAASGSYGCCERTQFLCFLGLLCDLFVGDSVLVHREEDDVLAAIHGCHDGVGQEDEEAEEGKEGEGRPGVVPEFVPIVPMDVFPRHQRNHEADANKDPEEDFVHQEKDGGVLPHVEGVNPAVLAVIAQGDTLFQHLVVIGTAFPFLARNGDFKGLESLAALGAESLSGR
ncbi:MAG: hypothetical protein IKP41_09070 [Bacteroidaceae bacterium]|nr:hypothetical protein [Bacteroidaceae bacterium]